MLSFVLRYLLKFWWAFGMCAHVSRFCWFCMRSLQMRPPPGCRVAVSFSAFFVCVPGRSPALHAETCRRRDDVLRLRQFRGTELGNGVCAQTTHVCDPTIGLKAQIHIARHDEWPASSRRSKPCHRARLVVCAAYGATRGHTNFSGCRPHVLVRAIPQAKCSTRSANLSLCIR